MVAIIALVTILAWGTWLLPEHYAAHRVPTVTVFYATLANLVVAIVVDLTFASATAPVSLEWRGAITCGGFIWAASGICAFIANRELGLARAVGFRTPINVFTSLMWGALLFDEFRAASMTQLTVVAIAVLALLIGLALIGFGTGGSDNPSGRTRLGWFCAATAGILWGSYYLPIRLGKVAAWSAALPLAIGMWIGALFVVMIRRDSLRLPMPRDYLLLMACGLLWASGNYGSLLLMEAIGPGRGFALAQLCLAINALLGIYLLRAPSPGSTAARRVLFGCALSGIGGILLGLGH